MSRLRDLRAAKLEVKNARRHLIETLQARQEGADAWEEEARHKLVGDLAYASMYRAAAHGRPIGKREAFVKARREASALIERSTRPGPARARLLRTRHRRTY